MAEPLNPRVRDQVLQGKIVCPRSGKPLALDEARRRLVTGDGAEAYPITEVGVPVLLAAPGEQMAEFESSRNMESEYTAEAMEDRRGMAGKLRAILFDDYRSPACNAAFARVFDGGNAGRLLLAVGGGPLRAHPDFTNLNIGPFPNVDVVGDAHRIPYAEGAVDAIYCEAVLEHLYAPIRAVEEMWRVLKPGGQVFACTPFLQAYHGYPHHYQNYTLTGHQRLFTDRGFRVLEAGACVGPVYTWVSLTQILLAEYAPLGRWLSRAWLLLSAPLRPLDRIIHDRANAHVMASTTYLVAEKPA